MNRKHKSQVLKHNMPFKSRAQAKFLHAVKPEVAKEFAEKTVSIKTLPEHVKKKKKEEIKKN